MYVFRVFQGAVCFQKETYYDWAEAVMAFANYSGGFYTHLVLEIYLETFTECWVKLMPSPVMKGGVKVE